VVRFDPVTGRTSPYAAIPDVHPCLPPVVSDGCDGSVLDAKPVPSGLAFDGAGALYIADAGQGAIWRVPAGGGDAKEFSVTRDWVSPARPSGPTGLAFDGAGNLVVVVRGMLTADTGGVFLIARGADGKAGEVKQLVATPDGARPTGVALGASGRVYVSFAGTGQVVVFGPGGTEAGRSPRTGQPGLSTPLGLAFLGNDILVAVQAPGAPDDGTIMRVPAGEPGGTVASRP
jgi:sugar lactone lactonase YvrE